MPFVLLMLLVLLVLFLVRVLLVLLVLGLLFEVDSNPLILCDVLPYRLQQTHRRTVAVLGDQDQPAALAERRLPVYRDGLRDA